MTLMKDYYKKNFKQAMMESLPNYYEDIREANEITKVEGTEFDSFTTTVDDVLNQFFVDTATWGLEKWEKASGIKTDTSKTYEQRRSAIKSKLRGNGTTTFEMIKNIGASFYEVEVIERPETYEVVIKSVGERGVPDNVTDLQEAIKQIIPAHLKALYEFTYLTWDELDASNTNYDTLSTYTWGELETSFF